MSRQRDDQEQGAGRPAVLPKADGPMVDVTLSDGQHLYAVVTEQARSALTRPDAACQVWRPDRPLHAAA